MKKIYFGLLIIIMSFLVFSLPDLASARNYGPTCNNSDDVNQFPFGFLCGTSPDWDAPAYLDPLGGLTGGRIQGGGTVTVNAGYRPANESGLPRKAGGVRATKLLFFVTINTNSRTTSGGLHPTNISGGGDIENGIGNASLGCPGDGGRNPSDGSSGPGTGPGKSWGDRDIPGNYSSTTAVNDINQSPYAYNPGSSRGVINCQDTGRMVYWIVNNPGTSRNFSFQIRTDEDFDASNIKVRADVAIRFDGDTSWFPPHNDGASDPPGDCGPGKNCAIPSGSANSKITSSHLVKQSVEREFGVDAPPPPPNNWKPTLRASCQELSGVLSQYNSTGSVITAVNTNYYKVQLWNPALNSGAGGYENLTNPNTGTVWNYSDASRNWSLPIDGAAIFGNYTLRGFRIVIDPNGDLNNSDWVYYTKDTGDDLPCLGFSPVLNTSATCAGGVTGTAYDPDSGGSVIVNVYDGPNGTGNRVYRSYTDGNNYFVYDVAAYQDGNDHTFSVIAEDNNGRNPNTGPINVSWAGCGKFVLTPAAGGAGLTPTSENPTSFEASNSVSATYPGWANPSRPAVTTQAGYTVASTNTITKNGASVGGPYPSNNSFVDRNYNFSYPISTLRAGDSYCTQIVVSPAEGLIEAGTGRILRVDRPSDQRSSGCQKVVNEPYVHVLGSDASAGGGFGANCTTQNGKIETYTKGNGGTGITPGGSGSQFGAFSISNSNGFSSALLRNNPPTGYTGLTFSNTSNSTGGSIPKPNTGGNLGGTNCVSDYFGKMPSALKSAASNTNVISGNRGNPGGAFTQVSEYYEPTGGTLTINGGTIADGVNIAIYVKGNVRINGNIIFANTSWDGLDKVPSLYIITSGGNIYIQPNVSRLDGLFVSQPSTSNVGGDIFTCSSGTTGYIFSNADLLAQCNNQLVVNGSFIAQKVYLSRSYGSIRSSYPGERLKPLNQNCGLDSTPTTIGDCAAEIFNFSPEAYIAQPAVPPNTGPTTGKYDYVTSLAPVL